MMRLLMDKNKVTPYVMILPAMIIFFLFFIIPIGYMIYLSFHDWNFVTPDMNFIGLTNYTTLANDGRFQQVLSNTVAYTLGTVGLTIIIALFIALWLNKKGLIYSFAQSSIFSPHIISLVSVSMLWMWIMDDSYGLLNQILNGLGMDSVNWLTDSKMVIISLIIVSVWKSVGYYTLIFIAGLQSIPEDIYEAAALDNTSKLRKLFKITIPMLSPTIFFVGITSIISSFKVFETINIMTQGGPANASNTLVYYIYEYGFKFFRIGHASAAGVILLIVISIFTFIYFRLMSKRVFYQ
ncbi:MAG: sugar ABC transporter permease [Tissierellia bacterium]|nr:sugar ABC transporter permease [Tissierellia bacterium]